MYYKYSIFYILEKFYLFLEKEEGGKKRVKNIIV